MTSINRILMVIIIKITKHDYYDSYYYHSCPYHFHCYDYELSDSEYLIAIHAIIHDTIQITSIRISFVFIIIIANMMRVSNLPLCMYIGFYCLLPTGCCLLPIAYAESTSKVNQL